MIIHKIFLLEVAGMDLDDQVWHYLLVGIGLLCGGAMTYLGQVVMQAITRRLEHHRNNKTRGASQGGVS